MDECILRGLYELFCGYAHQAYYQRSNRSRRPRIRPNKLQYDQAQELAYREWYLLPDEKEQPSLTFDPSSLEASTEITD